MQRFSETTDSFGSYTRCIAFAIYKRLCMLTTRAEACGCYLCKDDDDGRGCKAVQHPALRDVQAAVDVHQDGAEAGPHHEVAACCQEADVCDEQVQLCRGDIFAGRGGVWRHRLPAYGYQTGAGNQGRMQLL